MFNGPGGDYSAPLRDRYSRVLQLAQDAEEGRVSPRAGGSSRIDTSLVEQGDRDDAERERLAMTPGVREGGSTATIAQSDSPLNVGASRSFERFGDTYSYDPTAAAEEVGSVEATKAAASDRTRYDALQKMPGFSPRQAARLVYGRGDVIDTDESRKALADYVREPSRDTAATAIERGASPYAVPFTQGFDPTGAERARPGTQAYLDMELKKFREEESLRAERSQREIQLRDSLRDGNQRSRTYKYIGKDNKEHVVDLDTGKEVSVSPTEVRPTGRAAGPGAAFMNGGAAATPSGDKSPVNPDDVAAGFVRDTRKARTPESDAAEHERFTAYLQRLKAAGRTREEAAAIMEREGWDVMTGLQKR